MWNVLTSVSFSLFVQIQSSDKTKTDGAKFGLVWRVRIFGKLKNQTFVRSISLKSSKMISFFRKPNFYRHRFSPELNNACSNASVPFLIRFLVFLLFLFDSISSSYLGIALPLFSKLLFLYLFF